MAPTQPNILLLFSDQHRADAMGCAGDPIIQTPNLDRLAAEGVRFSRAHCNSPLCMPSRASITTGLYPHNHGVLDNGIGNVLPILPTFMRGLQQAGYYTPGIGKFHYCSTTTSRTWTSCTSACSRSALTSCWRRKGKRSPRSTTARGRATSLSMDSSKRIGTTIAAGARSSRLVLRPFAAR